MNNAQEAICQNLFSSKSYLAFRLGHQQVVASTLEDFGTAVAEMQKVTDNQSFQHPLLFYIFVVKKKKESQYKIACSVPPSCWPQVDNQGWNCLVYQSLFWNWNRESSRMDQWRLSTRYTGQRIQVSTPLYRLQNQTERQTMPEHFPPLLWNHNTKY